MSATTQEPLLRLENVTTTDEEAHYATVAARVADNERRKRRLDFLKTVGLILAVPGVMSGWIYRSVKPVVETRIDYVPLMPDGTIVNALRWENVPSSQRNDVALNTVVNYVRQREGYSRIGAAYAWNVVNALSTEKVQEEYARTNDPTLKTSPWQRYGETTRVDIAYDGYRPICDGTDCGPNGQPNGYEIRYYRREITNGVAGNPQPYYAQLRIKRDVDGLDPRIVAAINGARILVDYYVPGVPAGVNTGG